MGTELIVGSTMFGQLSPLSALSFVPNAATTMGFVPIKETMGCVPNEEWLLTQMCIPPDREATQCEFRTYSQRVRVRLAGLCGG